MSVEESPREGSYRFDTPERVEVAYDLAGLGSRFVAALIDGVVMACVMSLFFLLFAFGLALAGIALARLARRGGDPTAVLPLIALALIVATFVVLWGYHVFFEMVWHGQTPGKRAMGLRVIKEGGYPVDLTASAIRNLVRVVDYLPWSYALGAIVMFLDPRSRRLGDMAAGTLVVKERGSLALSALGLDAALLSTIPGPVGPGSPAPSADDRPLPELRRLTSGDQTLLRDYFQRRATLAPSAAEALAHQLAGALASRLGYELGGESPDRFLVRVAAGLAARAR